MVFQSLGRETLSAFNFYLSLIPSEGPFYRRPGVVTKSTVQPYFTKQVVNKITLNGIVQMFGAEAVLIDILLVTVAK